MSKPSYNPLWPAAKTEKFIWMVNQGYSIRQVSGAFGLTRNSAIGKGHRLKLRFTQVKSPRQLHRDRPIIKNWVEPIRLVRHHTPKIVNLKFAPAATGKPQLAIRKLVGPQPIHLARPVSVLQPRLQLATAKLDMIRQTPKVVWDPQLHTCITKGARVVRVCCCWHACKEAPAPNSPFCHSHRLVSQQPKIACDATASP